MNKKVVITGIGPISSLGIGKDSFSKNLFSANTNIVNENFYLNEESWASFPYHKVTNFDLGLFNYDKGLLSEVMKWKNEERVLDLEYLLSAAKLALIDAKLEYSKTKNNIGLVLGHENPGINQFTQKAFDFSYDFFQSNSNKKSSKLEYFSKAFDHLGKSVYDLQHFMYLFHVAKILSLHGSSFFINNACASGLYALEVASMMIKQGHCDVVVVSVADTPDIYKYLWFKKLGIYAEDGLSKPFSRDPKGIVFGEGGAGIVIESYECASNRKAKIYAEYVGGAFTLEAWKVVYPAVTENFYEEVIKKTISSSGISIDKFDLVVPHGVGLKVTDAFENKVLSKIFNKNTLYSVFKPYVGHNLGGSALLETIILLLAMEFSKIPPVLDSKPYMKNLMLNLVESFISKDVKIACKTVTAFAGFNAAAIFKKD